MRRAYWIAVGFAVFASGCATADSADQASSGPSADSSVDAPQAESGADAGAESAAQDVLQPVEAASDAEQDAVEADAPVEAEASVCGDWIKNGTEPCDKQDLGGQTCVSQGFRMGQLLCDADCQFDTTQCSNDFLLSEAGAKFFGQTGTAQLGYSLSSLGDINGDGFSDIVLGEPGGMSAGASSAARIFLGGHTSTGQKRLLGSLSASQADVTIQADSAGGANLGFSVAGIGDFNGDQKPDLLVSDPYASGGTGAVYFFWGPLSSGSANAAQAPLQFRGVAQSTCSGWSVAGLGDVNGDGKSDVLVGAPYVTSDGQISRGAAYLIYGGISEAGQFALAQASVTMVGEDTFDWAGYAVAGAGDFNGDGYQDMLIGSLNDAGGTSFKGAAYLVYGGPSLPSQMTLAQASVKFVGMPDRTNSGRRVAGLGDINHDGYDDILIGSWQQVPREAHAYVVYGRPDLTGTVPLAQASIEIVGEPSDGLDGMPVGRAGDVNADGFADFLMADPFQDDDRGAAYLLKGKVDLPQLVLLSKDRDLKFVGEGPDSYTGMSLTTAGDVDGDGKADLLFGAPNRSVHGSHSGVAYLVYADQL